MFTKSLRNSGCCSQSHLFGSGYLGDWLLKTALNVVWECYPRMPLLLPDRQCWWWKLRICKSAHRDPEVVGKQINLPKNGCSTIRAELRSCLAASKTIANKSASGSRNADLMPEEISADAKYRSCTPLALDAVAGQNDCWLARNFDLQCTTTTLRCPCHSFPLPCAS